MYLRGGNHVEHGHCDGSVALAQARHSVRHWLEARLPRSIYAQRHLVPAADITDKRPHKMVALRTYTASTQMVHWMGLSFMAL